MTNTTWIEWFQVVALLGLTVWMLSLVIRVRGNLRAAEKLREDVRERASDTSARAKKAGDPYRTPAERVHLPVIKDPVYCTDCRFEHETESFTICLAMPTHGEYLLIGQPDTNENHDCAHFQKKQAP